MKRHMMIIAGLFTTIGSAIAQDADQIVVEEAGPVVQLITSLLPVIFVFLILWMVFTLVFRKNRPYQKRAEVHMDRMEMKYDRIIQLLEELTKKQE